MYPHLPEQVLRKFGYLHGILIDLIVASLTTVPCKDVDGIFTNYNEHLGPEDVRSVPAIRLWSAVYNYI